MQDWPVYLERLEPLITRLLTGKSDTVWKNGCELMVKFYLHYMTISSFKCPVKSVFLKLSLFCFLSFMLLVVYPLYVDSMTSIARPI